MPPRPPERIYETVLYADDIEATTAFYRDVVGLEPIFEPDELGVGFRLRGGAILLVFEPTLSSRPGRAVPSHGATGAGHVAFAVAAGEAEAWRARLGELGIAIEAEAAEGGCAQLYVRDPAGNSVEFVEGDVWR